MLDTYKKRDASETTYSLLKSQEGFDTTRVHSTESILAKFALGFITSILRSEIQIACKDLGLDTNEMLHKSENIHIFLASGNEYVFSGSVKSDQEKLLSRFGITEEHLEALTAEINYRLDTVYKNRYRAVPDIKNQTPKHFPSKSKELTSKEFCDDKPKRGEGTITQPVYVEGKKRGRKKGSKDSYPRKRRTKAEMRATSSM